MLGIIGVLFLWFSTCIAEIAVSSSYSKHGKLVPFLCWRYIMLDVPVVVCGW